MKSDEVWEQLVEEAEKLYRKSGKQLFAKAMLAAVISELERIDKRQKNMCAKGKQDE